MTQQNDTFENRLHTPKVFLSLQNKEKIKHFSKIANFFVTSEKYIICVKKFPLQSILKGVQSIINGNILLCHMGDLSLAQPFVLCKLSWCLQQENYESTVVGRFAAEAVKSCHILSKLSMIKWWKEIEFVVKLFVNISAGYYCEKE